jgi:hypothetical protein
MRVLAVRQPWASLIVEGLKTIEVRSKPTNIKERVAIYSSTSKITNFYFNKELKIQKARDGEYPKGAILGTVEIVASSCCNDGIEYDLYTNEHLAPVSNVLKNKLYVEYGDIYFWHLRRPVKFSQPIPYKPPKGAVVWSNFELPEEAK